MRETVSERAWVQAMLDVEAALARVESRLGVIPATAADAIAAQSKAESYDIADLGRKAADSANPVVPLLAALRERLPTGAAAHVHRGATSQDIIDTAMMLIARAGLDLILGDLKRAADAAASLADRHRSTLMVARTLMQQASVTTFGLKAAGWLNSIVEVRSMLDRIRNHRLALQFGGAVGTLASLSGRGGEVATQLAAELRLYEPALPWHTARGRVAEVGAGLAIAAGAAGKVALDVVLLAQTEVGEVRERRTSGRGGSSTLPQKQNPVGAIEILAAVRGVNAQASLLLGTMVQEHERAAGSWQAEWPAMTEALRLTGGAAFRLADLLEGLDVDTERMGANLGQSGGILLAEKVVTMLAERVDGATARDLVNAAVATANATGQRFQDVVVEDPAITVHINREELTRAFDSASYVGASDALIDRALDTYRNAPTVPSPKLEGANEKS